jgi:PilZ domain
VTVTISSLTRTKPIRIYDVSAGGCLLESREPLPVGTVGLLTMNFDGRLRQEWIRVCRVQADESRRGPCLVSVEFLPLEPASAASLRGAVLRLRAVGTRTHFPMPSGRSSGDTGKSVERGDAVSVASSPVATVDHEDHEDLNSSCISLELATPLLSSPARACPKPEKE